MGGMGFNLVLLVHVLAGLGLIGLVLMQHGKGADMGAAFGSGASGSLFGSSGSANFLSRTTAVLATVFFITTLSLAFIAKQAPKASTSEADKIQTTPAKTIKDVAPAPEVVPEGKKPESEIPVPE